MKARTLGAALCGAVLMVSGCGAGADAGQDTNFAKGGTYTASLGSDPGSLNPLQAVQNTTNEVVPFAYDSLINVDPAGKVVSGLAASWKVAPKSVTYTLRKDVTCGDGSALTAKQVAANFTYVKHPKNHSSVIGGGLPDTDFTVTADDAARTVTLTVGKPYGFLVQGVGLVPIVCAKGLADVGSLAHHTYGTGPFTLTGYAPDDHLTFSVRKDYRWGPGGAGTNVPGFPDKVVFKIVKDETTAANLLLSGQLNDAAIAGPDVKRLKGHGFHTSSSYAGPDEMWYNQRSGHPGADPAVRKALTMALDLDQLTKVMTQGQGIRAPSLSVIEPRPCKANTVNGALPAHDLAAAKAALDQAGWAAGAGGVRARDGHPLKLTLMYSSEGGEAESAAMELARQWWKQLGVDVALKVQGTNAFVQKLFQGNDWDAAFLGVGIGYPNQFMSFAAGPASPKGQNFAAVSNASYGKLAAQALATPGQAGCDLWVRAEQALFANVDVVPVSSQTVVFFDAKARSRLGLSGVEPTSVRLLAG